MAVTTSIRMPDEIYEQYEMLARATGRTRSELMIEVLRGGAERELREIALVQEGLAQARAHLGVPIEDVVAQFKVEGILSPDFVLDVDAGRAARECHAHAGGTG